MSATNGASNGDTTETKKQLTIEEMRIKAKELRIANRYHKEQMTANLLEGLYDAYGWSNFGGGTDLYEPALYQRNQGLGAGVPPAQPSDRAEGRKWPVWTTETQLHEMMQASRLLSDKNSYAQGMLSNWVNAIVGKGNKYKVGARDTEEAKQFGKPVVDESGISEPGEDAEPEKTPLDKLTTVVQDWLDHFFASNNWTTTSLPEQEKEDGSTLAGGDTKERESVKRVPRDGGVFLRLFYNQDGTTDIRFVDPECVWGCPAGKSYVDGWSYGIQNKVERFEDDEGREQVQPDRECVLAYFVRPHSALQAANNNIGGEVVPAWNMIHIKIPGEDCEVKHGMPLFRFDVLAALIRAGTLQNNLSISAAVRAATAEVWKHTIGTQQQIASLQSPGIGATTIYPPAANGSGMTVARVPPGAIRRIPASQEPVPFPTTTNVEEHQAAAQGDLRQAGAAVSMTESMISADSSNTNYAALIEAGSPWVASRESDQEYFKRPFLCLCWRVIRHAVKCQKLPEQALTLLEITIESPIVHKDNKGEMASVMSAELQAKVTSPQIEIGKRGHDPRRVQSDWQEWNKKMGQQQQGQPGTEQSPEVEEVGGGAPIHIPDQRRSEAAKRAWASRAHGVMESAEIEMHHIPADILAMIQRSA